MSSQHVKNLSLAILLFALAFGFYARTAQFEWLTSEDLAYTIENPYLTKEFIADDGNSYSYSLPVSIKYCVTTLDYNQWIPLPLMVHKAMMHVFGPSPGPQHLFNALLHGIITALVFLLFSKLTRRPLPVALGCILLAVHPQHVQLVAWIAELKDLLAYLFATLSALTYLSYIDSSASKKSARTNLILSVAFLAVALSCRFIVAGLPLALASFHHFREKKVNWGTLKPHFLLSCLSLISTGYFLYSQEARFGLDTISLIQRVGPLFYVPFQYLEKTIFSYPLTFFNPFPKDLSLGIIVTSFSAFTIISFLTWRFRDRHPELSLMWFWFIATLLPVCGIFTIGPNHYSDHYSYLPHFALFPGFFLFIEKILPHKKSSSIALVILGIILALPTAYNGWRQLTPQRSTNASMTFEGNIQSDCQICLTTAHLLSKGLHTRNGTEIEAPQPETSVKLLTRALTDPKVKRNSALLNHPDYKRILPLLENPDFIKSLEGNTEELSKIIRLFNQVSSSKSAE